MLRGEGMKEGAKMEQIFLLSRGYMATHILGMGWGGAGKR